MIGGANLGYGYFWDRIYTGVETAFNFTNLEGDKKTLLVNGNANLNHKVELKSVWDISARFGYLITERVLPYIKIGVAAGRWKAATEQHPLLGSGSKSKTRAGLHLGAGCDFAVMDRVSVGGEYTFTNYGSFSHDIKNTIGQGTERIEVTPRVSTFMVRARYRFY